MPAKEKTMTKTKKAAPPEAAKILSRKTVFEDYHKLEVVKVQPRSLKDNDGWCHEMEREIFFGKSIAITGGPQLALVVYLAFYAVCLAMTWWFYLRRGSLEAGVPGLAEARV